MPPKYKFLLEMRNITVGHFDLLEKTFISGIEINKNFLNLLKHYVNVMIIPIAKAEEIENSFRRIKKYKLDYLYIDSFNFLLLSFLLREKLELDIAFILKIHTVFNWVVSYACIIPLIKKYDIIFAPSDYAKESFLKISDKIKVQVIPNFLDIKYIQKNTSYNFKESKKVITFMGRLTEEKGIGTLIKCMPKIMSEVDNVDLNIIGPLSGEEITDYPQSPYVRKLKKEVNRLKLTNRVHFKGARFGLDKYKILSESDVFVSPTTALEENFPVANIEALACGVPVITTNWAGNKELIRDGKNGFLIDINYDLNKKPEINTKQLISVIAKTLKNKHLSYKMRRNSLSSAQYYDYHRILPRLVSLLKKKANSAPPPKERGFLKRSLIAPLPRPCAQERGIRRCGAKAKVKSNWDFIKDKTLLDFRDIFNKDFFFFINIDNILRKKTYSSLYEEDVRQMLSKKRIYPNNTRRDFKKPRHTNIMRGLRQNLLHFLLLTQSL